MVARVVDCELCTCVTMETCALLGGGLALSMKVIHDKRGTTGSSLGN